MQETRTFPDKSTRRQTTWVLADRDREPRRVLLGRFDPDVLRFYDDLYENDYLFLVILIMAEMIANIHVFFSSFLLSYSLLYQSSLCCLCLVLGHSCIRGRANFSLLFY